MVLMRMMSRWLRGERVSCGCVGYIVLVDIKAHWWEPWGDVARGGRGLLQY